MFQNYLEPEQIGMMIVSTANEYDDDVLAWFDFGSNYWMQSPIINRCSNNILMQVTFGSDK